MPSSVDLYIYDLSQGMASQFSPLVGFQLDGIWHTAIVAYGREWFFGSGGVEQCAPGTTMLGPPLKTQNMGTTQLDYSAFHDYLEQLGRDRFKGERYQLLQHNCNNFSEEVSKFLTGNSIPDYILELPRKVMNSPIAAMLAPIIEQATPHGQNIDQVNDVPPKSTGSSTTQSDSSSFKSQHFPQKEFILYKNPIDKEKLEPKLKSLFEKNDATNSSAILEILTKLVIGSSNLNSKSWDEISKLLEMWPKEDVFPILDILRFCASKQIEDENLLNSLTTLIMKKFVTAENPTNCQLSLKILTNFLNFETSKNFLLNQREDLVSKFNSIAEESTDMSSALQIAISSLVLNLSLSSMEEKSTEKKSEAAIQLVSSIGSVMLPILTDAESLYRIAVALGTILVQGDGEIKDLALALDMPMALTSARRSASPQEQKVKDCVEDCLKILKS